MRKFLFISFVALGLYSCSSVERQGTLYDLGLYVGAPQHIDGSIDKDSSGVPVFDGKPDYDPREVAISAANKAAQSAGSGGIYGTIAWIAGGAGALALGWFKRRFLVDTGKAVIAKVSAAGSSTDGEGSAPLEK